MLTTYGGPPLLFAHSSKPDLSRKHARRISYIGTGDWKRSPSGQVLIAKLRSSPAITVHELKQEFSIASMLAGTLILHGAS